uniref:Uncharacterized protein LOC105132457 isoform X12 n=1 Tax=Rhizophora mucronata TaxID=61149 RepID=A0A2P2K4K9_RHIMU
MAEEDSKFNYKHPPPFLEVLCKSSGKTSRFAAGTKAEFAVSLINRKLEYQGLLALHIEAVKDGEEPISFGPDAVLVDYGNGWRLQTVTELDYGGLRKKEQTRPTLAQIPNAVSLNATYPTKTVVGSGFSFLYVAKILLAFVLIFALGAIFTLALENLPRLILFMNSYM